MNTILNQLLGTFFTSILLIGNSIGQEYQKISGVFYNNNQNTVLCGCSAQGLLSYVHSNGNTYTMTLCFDTEPGSYYEIFNGEKIVVEGQVKNTPCANGKSYLVLYVEKSHLPILNRREILPEEFKTNQQTTTNSKSDSSIEGYYIPKGRTMDDWSGFDDCTECGRFENNRDLHIVFDNINDAPSNWGDIKVWGVQKGRNFYVTSWENTSE